MDEELRKSLRVPLFCPHCSRIMKGSKSNISYYQYNCCSDCYIEFIEGREEKWKNGERPSEERLKLFLEKIDS